MRMKQCLALMAALATGLSQAKIEMGTPFSDQAVLQRGVEVPVWGTAEPDSCVTVAFAGAEVATETAANGNWLLKLPAMTASSENRAMTVTERTGETVTDRVEISDILVGEVWFASGQSNMECPIWGGNPRYRDGAGSLVTAMDHLPNIRFAKNDKAWSAMPARAKSQGWKKFESASFTGYTLSAVAYYYAREIYLALGGVPVGIVDASWGGTNIDAWTPRCGYAGCDESIRETAEFPIADNWDNSMRKGPIGGAHQQPTVLFNGMVDSWAPMAMRGLIWYQGCHNNGESQFYCAKLHALYNGWSRQFANPGLKFYLVQLAPYTQNWLGICTAQNRFCAEEPNAALAVTADVGNFDDIHPNNKEIVAKRLAVHALKRDYGFAIDEDDSPVLESARRVEDGAVAMTFKHVKSWYVYAPDWSIEPAFEVAGEDGEWKSAKLQNVEKNGVVKGVELVVKSEEVAAPVKVRYLVRPRTMGTVYNQMSLPLGPFAADVVGLPARAANSSACVAVSPDGRNEISVSLNPLCYEVRRDGKVLVAPTPLDLAVDGTSLSEGVAEPKTVVRKTVTGKELVPSPVYKKSQVDVARNETFLDFGDWGVALAARDDGVAYRFETKMPGRIRVDGETAGVAVPNGAARCWLNFTRDFGLEETVPEAMRVRDVATEANGPRRMVYLPFVYEVGGKTVAVTESDVCDYPIWNLVKGKGSSAFDALFAPLPKTTCYAEVGNDWSQQVARKTRGRWEAVTSFADELVETEGTRTFPWRVFILADEPSKLCEADIVWALARAPAGGHDFSWVKPGQVAWDWWNAFDNKGDPEGCTTATYERFIDFAAKNGIGYVIFDEGWSEKLDIWRFSPVVDVPHLIDYANRRGVGIILWMAWGQVIGDEARVAEYFARLGAKGFKVDFMDRGDAACERFLWKFAEECRKNRMLVDYHGAHRPTGMSRAYPNVLNYEGVHGLECMKCYKNEDFMANDVRAFFLRMTAGPLDYTPGAMDNYPLGRYEGTSGNPGSLGTRVRQMAMMALYEAPLQMLCDAPTKYERNAECFAFMANVPTVWADTVALGGSPDTFAAVARKGKDGAWYAAGITNKEARDFAFTTDLLGDGEWKAEFFRDADDADTEPTHFVHEKRAVRSGEKFTLHMAPGGGFIIRFSRMSDQMRLPQ